MLNYYKNFERESIEEGTLHYMQNSIARILVSQLKIYISFPLKNGMRKEAMLLDKRIKKEFPEIYGNVKNKSIWLLRKTKYLLFPLAVLCFRIKQ